MFDKRISFFVALVIGMVAWKSEIFFSSRTQQTHSSSEPDATTSSRKKSSLLALLNADEELKRAWLGHRVPNVHSNEVTQKANVGQSLPSPPLRSPALAEIHAHHLTNTRRHDLVTLPKDIRDHIPAAWANVTSTSLPSMSISASLFQQPQGPTTADESELEAAAAAAAPPPPPPCGLIGDRCESSHHGIEAPCCDQNTTSHTAGTVVCHHQTGGEGNRCKPRETPIPTGGLCSPSNSNGKYLWYWQFAACAQDADHCRRCHDSEKKLHRCLPKAPKGEKCWLLKWGRSVNGKWFADMEDCEDLYVCQPPTGSFAPGYFVEGFCAETTPDYTSVVMSPETFRAAQRGLRVAMNI